MARQFARNRNRSAVRVVKKSDSYNGGNNETVMRLPATRFYSYQSNESRTLAKAINRKPRR